VQTLSAQIGWSHHQALLDAFADQPEPYAGYAGKAAVLPEGMPMAAWALAWCLRHPAVSTVIAGSRSVEQVQSNAAAADLELVPEEHPQAL
jgi:aryl-alcohol dehydrogenase-like predicted oxidoreductase